MQEKLFVALGNAAEAVIPGGSQGCTLGATHFNGFAAAAVREVAREEGRDAVGGPEVEVMLCIIIGKGCHWW